MHDGVSPPFPSALLSSFTYLHRFDSVTGRPSLAVLVLCPALLVKYAYNDTVAVLAHEMVHCLVGQLVFSMHILYSGFIVR